MLPGWWTPLDDVNFALQPGTSKAGRYLPLIPLCSLTRDRSAYFLPIYKNLRVSVLGNHPYVYSFCMSIRPALQTAAISSDESSDLLVWEGKKHPRVGAGRLW